MPCSWGYFHGSNGTLLFVGSCLLLYWHALLHVRPESEGGCHPILDAFTLYCMQCKRESQSGSLGCGEWCRSWQQVEKHFPPLLFLFTIFPWIAENNCLWICTVACSSTWWFIVSLSPEDGSTLTFSPRLYNFKVKTCWDSISFAKPSQSRLPAY